MGNRKTVSPQDVIAALRETELDPILQRRLQAELEVYTEAQTAKRNEYRRKQKESAGGSGAAKGNSAGPAIKGGAENGDDDRGANAQLEAEMGQRMAAGDEEVIGVGGDDVAREVKRRRTDGAGAGDDETAEEADDAGRYGEEEEGENEEVGDEVEDDEDEDMPAQDRRDDEDEMARLENERPDHGGDTTDEVSD